MDLKEVKACLRALLSSSANSYTLKPLLGDFKNMTGYDLPLFGCRNPVEFLKTLNDTVQLTGDLYNPILVLVESEKSSHITSLVKRQRTKKFNNGNPYGRSLPPRLIRSSLQMPPKNSSLNRNNLSKKDGEKKNNYGTAPVTAEKYSTHGLFDVAKPEKVNQKRNHSHSSMNQPRLTLKFQNSYQNTQNEFSEPSETSIQSGDVYEGAKRSGNNSKETEKTDSCYFEGEVVAGGDFSDIDSTLSTEEYDDSPPKSNSACDSIYINDGIKSKLQKIIKKFPDGLWCCELPNLYLNEFNVVLDYREFGCTSVIEMLSELPDVFRCIRPGNEDWLLFDASVPPSEKEKKMMKLQENGSIARNLANNVYKLLLRHRENSAEEGILLTEIPRLYQTMFEVPLDFQSFGFSSVKSLLETFEGTLLNFRQVDENCMVVPVSKSDIPSPVPWKAALPPITKDNDIFKEIFPKDVVGPEGSLPELDLSLHIAVGQRIEVCVAEVWSPGEFYLQLNKFKNRWNRFSTELQGFYNTHLNKYKMPDSTITPQQLCVGLYSEDAENPDEWNRARILQVINERTIMVEFVDFGTVARVKKTQLRFMHKNFQSLPIQAFLAELYNLAPKKGDMWSMRASKKFLDLSRVSYLEAELIDIDFKKPLVKVVLYDTSCVPKLNLNKQLIAQNLAKSIEIEEKVYKFDSKKPQHPKTRVSENPDNDNSVNVVCDEFSDASDLDSNGGNSLFLFKMKSRKALDDKEPRENKEGKKSRESVEVFGDVSNWVEINGKPSIKACVKKKESKVPDLFEVKEDPPPWKNYLKPDEAKPPSPKKNLPSEITKRLPPGLEHTVEPNLLQIVALEQPDEIKKKINILAVDLLTMHPSIKQIAIQDPSVALTIASEMAEVYISYMCYGANPFRASSFPGDLSCLSMPFTGTTIFPPVSPSVTGTQPKKDTTDTNITVKLSDTADEEPCSFRPSKEKSECVKVETIEGKKIHTMRITGQVYFFAEELIRTFSSFSNRDVADRVLYLKKIVVKYKILNKNNAGNILKEIKCFDIPGIFRKKSKKLNVYLIPADSVIAFLEGLGFKSKSFQNYVISLEKPEREKGMI